MAEPVVVQSGISTIVGIISGLGVVAGGVASVIGLRIQRDIANVKLGFQQELSKVQVAISTQPSAIKEEILNGINGKYVRREEHLQIEKSRDDLLSTLDRERQTWENSTDRHFDSIKQQFVEERERLDGLREEFVTCRAAHRAGGKE